MPAPQNLTKFSWRAQLSRLRFMLPRLADSKFWNSLGYAALGVAFLLPLYVYVCVPIKLSPYAWEDLAHTAPNKLVSIPVLINDCDPFGLLSKMQVEITTPPVHGTIEINPQTGFVDYTPDKDYAGGDTFYYTARSEKGMRSNVSQVEIKVIR